MVTKLGAMKLAGTLDASALDTPGRGNAGGGAGGGRREQAVIVRLAGHIDRAAAESCEWLLHSAGEGVSRVVVDLLQATSFDRDCLAIFVARARKLKARRGCLAFAASALPVLQVVRPATGDIQVFPSVNAAIDFVEGRGETVGVARSRRADRPLV